MAFGLEVVTTMQFQGFGLTQVRTDGLSDYLFGCVVAVVRQILHLFCSSELILYTLVAILPFDLESPFEFCCLSFDNCLFYRFFCLLYTMLFFLVKVVLVVEVILPHYLSRLVILPGSLDLPRSSLLIQLHMYGR